MPFFSNTSTLFCARDKKGMIQKNNMIVLLIAVE
jgi:hypothetical protein